MIFFKSLDFYTTLLIETVLQAILILLSFVYLSGIYIFLVKSKLVKIS